MESWRPVPSGYASRSWWLVEEQKALSISEPAVVVSSRQSVCEKHRSAEVACCPVTVLQPSIWEHRVRDNSISKLARPFFVDKASLTTGIIRAAKKHKADIIHGHWSSVIGLCAARAARTLGVAYVAEMRFDLASAMVAQQARWDLKPVEPLLRRWFDRHLAHADAIVAASEAMARLLRQSAHLRESTLHVVPNGISDTFVQACDAQIERQTTASRARNEKGEPAERIVLGTTAKMLRYENLGALIDVARLLPEIDLVFVGDGPERSNLEQQARPLNDERKGRVRFPGQVPATQIPEYLSRIDIFAIPRESHVITRHASPIKLVEAMAAKCSVVATAVGDSSTLLADEHGILVEPDDFPALLSAIRQLANDTQLRNSLGIKARKRITENYTSQRVIQNYRAAYQEALGVAHTTS